MTPALERFRDSEESLLETVINDFADQIETRIDLTRSPVGYWLTVFPDWSKWELEKRRA